MRKFTSHDYAPHGISRFFVVFSLLWSMGLNPLHAQRNLALYNLPGVPQSQVMNVGRMPDYNFHLSLPLISNINLSANSSGFSANDLRNIEFDGSEGSGESFFETDFSDFIDQIGPFNTLGFDFNTTLLDAGFRLGKGYIGLQAMESVNGFLGYSESLFTSFDEIQRLTPGDFDNGPRRYSVNGTFLNFSHHRTLGGSYTHEIIPGKLSAGVRAKMAIGIGRAWTRNENFSIVGDYQQGILGLEGNVGLVLAGLPAAFDSTQGFDSYIQGSGNQGLALDLGAQYRINDKIEVFASLVNLGQINWRNNISEYGYSTKYLDFYANQSVDTRQEALDEVIDFVSTPEKTKYLGNIKSPLPMYAYAGGNYHFNKTLSAGAMVNLERLDGFNYWNFTLNGRANLGRVLQAGVTLAQVQGIGFQLGAGAAVNLGPLQIYAASDNVSSVVKLGNARNAQLNVGINLVFGRGRTKTDVALQDSSAMNPSAIAVVDSAEQKESKVKTKTPKTKPEKTSVAKTKERPAPDPKPVKTTPAAPSTPVVTSTTTLRPWVNLRGTSFNASSKEMLTGVTVEMYQKQGDREVLAYVRGNPGIDILAPMDRTKEYRVVVKKNGFKPTETTIGLDELAGVAELKKDFFLDLAPEETPTTISKPAENPVEKPVEKPKETVASTTDTPNADGAKPNVENKPSSAAPQPQTKSLNVYVLVLASDMKPTPGVDGATVIRIGAGFRVQVLEKTNADWWLVNFRGNNGYVNAKALREEK
jgi:hypothetical protein